MRNILILITLISGLIFTSLIKNKTRLLEKELIYLDNEINSLRSNLAEASLDFQYLSTPKHISLLAKDFLDENFSYYKESQIQKSTKPQKDLIILKKLKNDNTSSQLSTEESVNKKSNVVKEIDNKQLLIAEKFETQITDDAFSGEETVKYLAILKKLKNDNTSSQLSIEESVNKKSNVVKEIDNKQLLIAERIDKKNSQKEKKKIVLKKIHKWTGIQAIKVFLGIPNIPVK